MKSKGTENGKSSCIQIKGSSRIHPLWGEHVFFFLNETKKERYGAMLTCMASRTVRIEVTCSSDTNSFILAFQRIEESIYGDGRQKDSIFPARTRS